MNITFATSDNMSIFWGYVKTLLGFAGPWVMIAVAIIGVGMLLFVIISAFKKSAKDDEEEKDDDYEVRHY